MKEPSSYQKFLVQITNRKQSGLTKEEKECLLAMNSYLCNLEQILEENKKKQDQSQKIVLAKKNLKTFHETVRHYKGHYFSIVKGVVEGEVKLFVEYIFKEIENFLLSFAKSFKLKLNLKDQEN